ncbi:MAG: hypothetical protein EA409_11895, partial [Saprospirales bacterium]
MGKSVVWDLDVRVFDQLKIMKTIKTDKDKLKYFQYLLEANPVIEAQYEEYFKDRGGEDKGVLAVDHVVRFMQSEFDDCLAQLRNVNLCDIDIRDYVPQRSGYIDHDEAMEHLVEDQLKNIVHPFFEEISREMNGGETTKALLKFIAIFDACKRKDVYDPEALYYEISSFLWTELFYFQSRLVEHLKCRVLPQSLTENVCNALFLNYLKYHGEDERYLQFFEPLLMAITISEDSTQLVEKLIRQYEIKRNLIPRFCSYLSFLGNDLEGWIRESEELIEYDGDIAQKVLQYYAGNDEKKFVRIAKKLWYKGLYRGKTAELYFKEIDPVKEPEFYKQVVLHLIQNEHREEYYRILQGLFSEEEKEKFIEKNKWNCELYAMMLHMEGRQEELLDHLRSDKYLIDFAKMIPYLYHSHPVESLKLIKEYILDRLSDRKYRRREYPKIVELLQSTHMIKGHDQKINELIRIVYYHQPTLPAMRSKMEMEGLV